MSVVPCIRTIFTKRISAMIMLVCTSVLGQTSPHQHLQDALALERKGQFELAMEKAKLAVESNQLSDIELARGYLILGALDDQVDKFQDAQAALTRSLVMLRHDPEHMSDYAAALTQIRRAVQR